MVRLAGFEPTTPWFVAKYSIQLSYSRLKRIEEALADLWGHPWPTVGYRKKYLVILSLYTDLEFSLTGLPHGLQAVFGEIEKYLFD
jgi:hypothetical protein